MRYVSAMAYSKEKQAAYHKAWTEQNRDKRYAANRRWREKSQTWFREYKAGLKCEKCGEDHPACLEFHHKDPNAKEGTLGTMAGHWSIKRLKTEIAKCRVLCANCHRKVHYMLG